MRKIKKIEDLKRILKRYPGVVVAFSGGVDSTLLLKIAIDVLNEKVIAVTAASPLYPEREIEQAKKIARFLKAKHIIINSFELKNRDFRANLKNRCYHCKLELFSKLKEIANRLGYAVIEGSNYSDLGDFRPGLKAAKRVGVESPLIQAKLKKDEIRDFARMFELPNWNKPSMACLASRIPYGTKIDEKVLNRVGRGERFLAGMGFYQYRVRDHYPLARIEILNEEFGRMIKLKERIVKYFKKIGYKYITIDLEGYRTGSMNL